MMKYQLQQKAEYLQVIGNYQSCKKPFAKIFFSKRMGSLLLDLLVWAWGREKPCHLEEQCKNLRIVCLQTALHELGKSWKCLLGEKEIGSTQQQFSHF